MVARSTAIHYAVDHLQVVAHLQCHPPTPSRSMECAVRGVSPTQMHNECCAIAATQLGLVEQEGMRAAMKMWSIMTVVINN